jgi:hypothetical protein
LLCEHPAPAAAVLQSPRSKTDNDCIYISIYPPYQLIDPLILKIRPLGFIHLK